MEERILNHLGLLPFSGLASAGPPPIPPSQRRLLIPSPSLNPWSSTEKVTSTQPGSTSYHTSYYKVTKHKQRLTTPNFLPKQWWSINFSKIINTHGPPFWHHPERSDLAQSCVCPSHQRARKQEPRASRNTRLRLCCATDKATIQSLHFSKSTKKETQGHEKANSTNSTTTPRATIITFRNSAHSAMV